MTAHSLTLTGLAPKTTYYYRVASGDDALQVNTGVFPAPPLAPASFTTPPPVFVDTTEADFGAGHVDASTYVAKTADGEVILKPAVGAEFTETIPADWFVDSWDELALGTAIIQDGKLLVDGALVGKDVRYEPGRSLEFGATFTDANQHIGFGIDFDQPLWAIFSSDGTQVFARTNNGGGDTCATAGPRCTQLGSGAFGSPRRYRIEWTSSSVVYYIDGVQVASHGVSITAPMRPLAASDFGRNGKALVNDWFRMSPYASSGVFVSRLFDAGSTANPNTTNPWGAISWQAEVPAGGSLTISVRTGNTSTPDDGTWTPFRTVPASGALVGNSSRYLQYRAAFTTGNTQQTPVLQEVMVQYDADVAGADGSSPIISAITATVADSATAVISWTTSEAATSRVDYSRPGTPAQFVEQPELVLQHRIVLTGLKPLTTYTYQVTSQDFSENSSMSLPQMFTTPAPTFTDTLVADFAQGQRSGTGITNGGGGEVVLARLVDEQFAGASLPAGWTGAAWDSGGSAAVTGGLLKVDGAQAITDTPFAAGQSLEFIATFGAEKFQHVGFVGDAEFNPPWVIFSTNQRTNLLSVRTNLGGGSFTDVELAEGYIGEAHRYRIDWTAERVKFSIDGVVVHQTALNFTPLMPLHIVVSDLNSGTSSLAVDALWLNTYVPEGSFVSRIFDAEQSHAWGALSWTSAVPAGTSLIMNVKTGNSPTPDTSWKTKTIASGAAIGETSRYIQYRADFAATNGAETPILFDVTIGSNAGTTNASPSAVDLDVAVTEDTPRSIVLSGTDPEGVPLTFTVLSGPAHGTLLGTAPALTYTPAPDFAGSDSFTYKANDGALDSNIATVSITIGAVNDAPVIADQSVTTPEDTVATITLGAATDVDGQAADLLGGPGDRRRIREHQRGGGDLHAGPQRDGRGQLHGDGE